MDFSSFVSDTIAGIVSALFISIPSYFFALKTVKKQIDKLNTNVVNVKSEALEILFVEFKSKRDDLHRRILEVKADLNYFKDINDTTTMDEYQYAYYDGTIKEYEAEIERLQSMIDDSLEFLLDSTEKYFPSSHK